MKLARRHFCVILTNMKTNAAPAPKRKRAYRQGARAVAAEQTASRILDAFDQRLATDWYDEITLEQIAKDAEVTAQTVIRRFGGKEGLFEAVWMRHSKEIENRRRVEPGDIDGAVRVIVEDYEAMGDLVWRSLAQEDRFPAIKAMADLGRRHHRGWIEQAFAPFLKGLGAPERKMRIDQLVTATDLYTWKLIRRDMGRSITHVRSLMRALIEGVLNDKAA